MSFLILPDEIITTILENNDCRDLINVGSTCKRLNELVFSTQKLWKLKFQQILPQDVCKIVEEHCNGQWLKAIQEFYTLKNNIYSELNKMSPALYWNKEVSLGDLKYFFKISLTSNVSYFYSIYILQQHIKIGHENIQKLIVEKPFTLTEIFYAKLMLRHLLHTFLTIKWVKNRIHNELSPEIVINFFLQWIDSLTLHSDDAVEDTISQLAKQVEMLLESSQSFGKSEGIVQKCINGKISQRQVLAAVTQAIYRQPHMAITSATNLDTLNIAKVMKIKCANVVTLAAIYKAVAKKFGVNCNLIAFPNHLFLEWRDECCPMPEVYTVDLSTGELHKKRRCPFSMVNQHSNYKYSADSLLQYIYSMFQMTYGALNDWGTQNASYLLDFMEQNSSEYNPYRNFFTFLLEPSQLPALRAPLDLKNLGNEYVGLLLSLFNLNVAPDVSKRNITVKRRDGRVQFAIGMECYHKKYDYLCIIIGWDVTCAATAEWQQHMAIDTLYHGANQPFYNVIASDQSHRYVAQENLYVVNEPTRLYHLEDMIAREFTHFDGYSYVPNNEKMSEYPDDNAIVSKYRARAGLGTYAQHINDDEQ